MFRMGRMDVARALRYDPRFEARAEANPSIIDPANMPQTYYEHHRYDASPSQLLLRRSLPADHRKRMKTNGEHWNEFFDFLQDDEEYQKLLATFSRSAKRCWAD